MTRNSALADTTGSLKNSRFATIRLLPAAPAWWSKVIVDDDYPELGPFDAGFRPGKITVWLLDVAIRREDHVRLLLHRYFFVEPRLELLKQRLVHDLSVVRVSVQVSVGIPADWYLAPVLREHLPEQRFRFFAGRDR